MKDKMSIIKNEKGAIQLIVFIGVILILTAVLFVATVYMVYFKKDMKEVNLNNEQQPQIRVEENSTKVENTTNNENTINNETTEKKESEIKGNQLSNFDLSFLKKENEKVNKVYSPLSIKYALKMLEDGAQGESKSQISKLIGNYNFKKYPSNANMSLANALFVKNTFQDKIKSEYLAKLTSKYAAEIKFDSFKNADNINSWISNKTLKLINKMIDEINPDKRFILVNALGIDMEWNQKFLSMSGEGASYEHEKFGWSFPINVSSKKFNDEKQTVSGMKIVASFNNYDIVKELGEDNIRKTVGDEYRKFLNGIKTDNEHVVSDYFGEKIAKEKIEEKTNEYLKKYISEINRNYHREDVSTEFSFYTDDEVKVFEKDLKEYDGTTLQYIGIMPTKENLDSYIQKVDETKLNGLIGNLKSLKYQNFKEGVVTKIVGFIPKFKFEYELKLMDDLKEMGVTDVFEAEKANLSDMTDDKVFIDEARHKANIEFTQDGIKAAAATIIGGAGAGMDFDYLYDIPVEEIDLTFNKPYMFVIRDKETGETWFTGTVYEPLSLENEPEKENVFNYMEE